jgi:hypothetical protein
MTIREMTTPDRSLERRESRRYPISLPDLRRRDQVAGSTVTMLRLVEAAAILALALASVAVVAVRLRATRPMTLQFHAMQAHRPQLLLVGSYIAVADSAPIAATPLRPLAPTAEDAIGGARGTYERPMVAIDDNWPMRAGAAAIPSSVRAISLAELYLSLSDPGMRQQGVRSGDSVCIQIPHLGSGARLLRCGVTLPDSRGEARMWFAPSAIQVVHPAGSHWVSREANAQANELAVPVRVLLRVEIVRHERLLTALLPRVDAKLPVGARRADAKPEHP